MKPQDFGIDIPNTLKEEDFCAGFEHGMQSNTLTKFKMSYRMGFRTAKLLLRELRKQQGVLQFPMKAKFKFKVID